ncbi:SRF-TF-domain-containing protein [Pisolithus orientalis]|uniref:SRF-TF-domain-containing protein n=1 Tax=Pisolithus orientalis TaxID=936130 RepID=UPI002225A554|nr:SRF-TF-domain-containing protein [Pisolithus orientalis]KAI6030728.1 SRF-TF-domain-containing protein [Pisolithus orientalis]
MSFRHIPSQPPTYPSYPKSSSLDDPTVPSPTMRKRQRTTLDMANPAVAAAAAAAAGAQDPQQSPQQQAQNQQSHLSQQVPAPAVPEDGFINDQDAAESGGDDDDEEEKPKDKKAGRRKIKIEFIQDKSRRHITFSKRKAGTRSSFLHSPALRAYELSTLTGTQVLLLVVSETGLVYTFTTAKLQPLVTQPEGKNLIQACLNASPANMPPSMPVGSPLPRSSVSMSIPGASNTANLPGGLSIPGPPVSGPQGPTKEDGDEEGDDEVARGGRTASAGDKRRRRPSTAGASSGPGRGGPGSPQTPNSTIPPPLSIPPPQQQHSQVPSSPQYGPSGGYASHGQHHGHHAGSPTDASIYSGHMMPPPGYAYPGGPGGPGAQGGQPLGGLAAAAAAQHNHWPPPPVSQGGHYGRR